MTEKECLNNIVQFCERELKKTRWFIFNDHSLNIERTRLLKDYEKDANLPLPPELLFPGLRINYEGIALRNNFYQWSDICLTVIKYDTHPTNWGGEGRFQTDQYLVFSLNGGDIFQAEMDNAIHYSNLIGHFIELYKNGNVKPR